MSPPNSVLKALGAALADACSGVLDVVPESSCWDADICTLLLGGRVILGHQPLQSMAHLLLHVGLRKTLQKAKYNV